MDCTSPTAAHNAFDMTFAPPHRRFKRRVKPAKAPLALQATLAQQVPVKEPYEVAIETLQRSFDGVIVKLDRIEAKVDMLAEKTA
jgi:hypothetical protein